MTGESGSDEGAITDSHTPAVHTEPGEQIVINTSTARVKVSENDIVVIRNGAEHPGMPCGERERLEFHFDRDEIISDRFVGDESEPSRFDIVDV